MSKDFTLSRRAALGGAVAAGAVIIAKPSVILAQTSDVIRFGHLTPRTGFLGPLGEYGVMAADLAVEEINAAGGVLGRKLEILKEDSVNPQTASTKAERMVERDKVAAIIGEISSASCLTIAQVAQRPGPPRHSTSTPAATRMPCVAPIATSTCSTSRARTRCM